MSLRTGSSAIPQSIATSIAFLKSCSDRTNGIASLWDTRKPQSPRIRLFGRQSSFQKLSVVVFLASAKNNTDKSLNFFARCGTAPTSSDIVYPVRGGVWCIALVLSSEGVGQAVGAAGSAEEAVALRYAYFGALSLSMSTLRLSDVVCNLAMPRVNLTISWLLSFGCASFAMNSDIVKPSGIEFSITVRTSSKVGIGIGPAGGEAAPARFGRPAA